MHVSPINPPGETDMTTLKDTSKPLDSIDMDWSDFSLPTEPLAPVNSTIDPTVPNLQEPWNLFASDKNNSKVSLGDLFDPVYNGEVIDLQSVDSLDFPRDNIGGTDWSISNELLKVDGQSKNF